ncbi:MAG TPA: histidine phosphatase family protein, partial [Pararhizobium sp.]|nr:histidine phosphatase family protein [Pararhizobium sp.]
LPDQDPTVSTAFYLVRHADHGHLSKVLTGRMPGVRLSQSGRAQAAALARSMGGCRFDALFSSPQARARETAEFISSATESPTLISDRIDEIDFGRWAGQPFDALERDPDWVRWNAARNTARTPAGESMSDVTARFLGFIDSLRVRFPGGTVCLVSHADVIKSAVCHYLGKPIQAVHDFEIAPASVTIVAVDDGRGQVVSLNETSFREPEEMAR